MQQSHLLDWVIMAASVEKQFGGGVPSVLRDAKDDRGRAAGGTRCGLRSRPDQARQTALVRLATRRPPVFGIAEEGNRLTMKQVKRAYPKDRKLDASEGRMADLPDDSDQR